MYIPHNMVSHIGKIFQGEYNIPYNKANIKILDIGANIGGFAIWASYKWPDSTIECYEPVLSNFELLKANTSYNKNITPHNAAVAKESEKRQIYYGKNNIGEASLFKGEEQQSVGELVETVAADSIGHADLVKIDTEGAEIEILSNIKIKPDIYLIEYHSAKNRRKIDTLLKDYTLIETTMRNYNYGILKYVKTDLLKG